MFVPTLRVHCSNCRVESRVSADLLAAIMKCEFCGQTYNLALSHSLSIPEWRYRLAAHVRLDQIQALLPALAASSLLAQLRHVQEPDLPLVLGLKVVAGGRDIEVDVAMYLPDPDWTVVLGEVKTGNRVDARDVSNLEYLQTLLAGAGVRCVLMFATLKERFSDEEVAELRGLAERSGTVSHSSGRLLPNVPLVLTAGDLSHHPMDENHPWRWKDDAYLGILGTALSSCRRNLGLSSSPHDGTAGGSALVWTD
jgi:hypothetical protein